MFGLQGGGNPAEEALWVVEGEGDVFADGPPDDGGWCRPTTVPSL